MPSDPPSMLRRRPMTSVIADTTYLPSALSDRSSGPMARFVKSSSASASGFPASAFASRVASSPNLHAMASPRSTTYVSAFALPSSATASTSSGASSGSSLPTRAHPPTHQLLRSMGEALSLSAPVLFPFSLLFFLIAYILCFSLTTHIILLCLYAGTTSILLSLYIYISERGLLSFLPNGLRALISEYTFLELVALLSSSTTLLDVCSLCIFTLSAEEQAQILHRLPPHMRQALVVRGVVHWLPDGMQRLLAPASAATSSTTPRRRRAGGLPRSASHAALSSRYDSSEQKSTPVSTSASATSSPAAPKRSREREERKEHDDMEEEEREMNEIGSGKAAAVVEDEVDEDVLEEVSEDENSQPSTPTEEQQVATAVLQLNSHPHQPLDFSALLDRTVQHTFQAYYANICTWATGYAQDWARSLMHHPETLLPASLSPYQAEIRTMTPIALTLAAMHLFVTSPRFRSFCIRTIRLSVDVGMCSGAIVAAFRIYSTLASPTAGVVPYLRTARGRDNRGADLPAYRVVRLVLLYLSMQQRRDRRFGLAGAVIALWLCWLSRGVAARQLTRLVQHRIELL